MERAYFRSPIGNLEILASKRGIKEIGFSEIYEDLEIRDENLALCLRELELYFSGNLREFSVKLDISGSEFERLVYEELLKIPYAKTITYKDLAVQIGKNRAFRAVGNANSKNKIPIIIPCHRIVSKNGIGGYNGGIWRKEFLLNLENTQNNM